MLVLKCRYSLAYTSLLLEGYPNGKEAVLKTAERKLLQVRVLSPPFHSLILAGGLLKFD